MDMMITAHSGCDGTEPNTMAYLAYAAGLPVDALEVDIRRAPGGELILSHNPVADSATPTLEAAFRFLSGRAVKINCDLKQPGLEADVLDCAERCGVAGSRIIFTGMTSGRMARHPEARVFVNAEELIPGFDERPGDPELRAALIARCGEAGYDVVNIDYRICGTPLMRACREAGIGLSLWTVDDLDALEAFQKCDAVVNITTNRAAEACRGSAKGT